MMQSIKIETEGSMQKVRSTKLGGSKAAVCRQAAPCKQFAFALDNLYKLFLINSWLIFFVSHFAN